MPTPYLRNIETGAVFIYTELLAQQPWMQPCDTLEEVRPDADANAAVEQAKATAKRRKAAAVDAADVRDVE